MPKFDREGIFNSLH